MFSSLLATAMTVRDRIYAYVSRDERLLLHIVMFLVGGFALLTLLVLLLPPSVMDLEFSEEMQEHRNPLLHWLMRAVSFFGNGVAPVITVGAAAAIIFAAGYRREAGFTLASTLIGGAVYLIKIAVNRPRPTADLVEVMTDAKFQSFPSGHVAFYVTFFGFLVFLLYRFDARHAALRWALGFLFLGLLFAVPFSRVYLGAHWFSDVLAGFFLGLLGLILLVRTYLHFSGRKKGAD